MKKAIIFILSIGFSSSVCAQTDFRSGYVITNSGDTLQGLLNYREGNNAHKTCEYKASKNSNVISYEPSQISGYGFVNDTFFQSGRLPGENNGVAVFFEVIIYGNASLYKFEKMFFIKKGNSDVQELVTGFREKLVDGKKYLKETNQYVGVLNILLFDCVKLRSEIPKAKLDEKSLSHLIENYNKCKGETPVNYKSSKPWIRSYISVSGGINSSKVQFQKYVKDFNHLSGKFEGYTSPMLGVSANISSPRFSEKFSLNLDFLYVNTEYKGQGVVEDTYAVHTNYMTIAIQSIKGQVGLRYTLPERKITPYLNGGISTTYHLKSKSSLVQEVESNNTVKTYETSALPISKQEIGIWMGIGGQMTIASKAKIFLEFRAEQTDGISSFNISSIPAIRSRVNNLQFIIGIRIK
jgi:hypothetical protein